MDPFYRFMRLYQSLFNPAVVVVASPVALVYRDWSPCSTCDAGRYS